MKRRRVSLMAILLTTFTLGAMAQSSTPSFDCSQASGAIEELICADDELAALDRKMAETYEKALKNWPPQIVSEQKGFQRGWIKGRDECWKADDKKSCVELEYRTRIVELQIKSGQLMAPPPVSYTCEGDEGKPFTAVFYQDTDPPSAVITFGDDQVIAFLQPTGSGTRYTAANMEFWEHRGEATVDWYGTALTCRPR